MTKPVIPPGLVQGTPTQAVLAGGYVRTPFRPVIAGFVQSGGGEPLTPPTVAPVLTVPQPNLGVTLAELSWTPSDKTTSPGFGYDLIVNGAREGPVEDNPYYINIGDTAPLTFQIVPYNDAGDGPGSNEVTRTYPGYWDEGPVLSGPASADNDWELTWTAIPGATLYRLYGATSDAGPYAETYTTASLTQTIEYDLSLPWWYVVADDGAGFLSGESNHHETFLLPPSTNSYYLRPDGTSRYLRPDGVSFYLRP